MAPSGKVHKIYSRIGNARRDYLHKISTTISTLGPFALGPFGRTRPVSLCTRPLRGSEWRRPSPGGT